jgi:hypothetical protein
MDDLCLALALALGLGLGLRLGLGLGLGNRNYELQKFDPCCVPLTDEVLASLLLIETAKLLNETSAAEIELSTI